MLARLRPLLIIVLRFNSGNEIWLISIMMRAMIFSILLFNVQHIPSVSENTNIISRQSKKRSAPMYTQVSEIYRLQKVKRNKKESI